MHPSDIIFRIYIIMILQIRSLGEGLRICTLKLNNPQIELCPKCFVSTSKNTKKDVFLPDFVIRSEKEHEYQHIQEAVQDEQR